MTVYPEFQGRGFATEAVRALVSWAVAQPGVARVRATIPPWNASSLRVAEKAGLRPVGTDVDEEGGEVQVWEAEADTGSRRSRDGDAAAGSGGRCAAALPSYGKTRPVEGAHGARPVPAA